MKQTMLSEIAIKFLKNEMSICVEDFMEKLHTLSNDSQNVLSSFVEYISTLEPQRPFNDNEEIISQNYSYLNKKLYAFIENSTIKEDTEEYYTFDSIRHAFISFKAGGIYNLYKNREAEYWYPKVLIRNNMGISSNVDDLDSEITIFRGTSKEEYDSAIYSQSWTLYREVAEEFAFKHYEHQEDCKTTSRIVLQTNISKSHVYYYDKHDDEQEIIIDERKLNEHPVIIIKEKTID